MRVRETRSKVVRKTNARHVAGRTTRAWSSAAIFGSDLPSSPFHFVIASARRNPERIREGKCAAPFLPGGISRSFGRIRDATSGRAIATRAIAHGKSAARSVSLKVAGRIYIIKLTDLCFSMTVRRAPSSNALKALVLPLRKARATYSFWNLFISVLSARARACARYRCCAGDRYDLSSLLDRVACDFC